MENYDICRQLCECILLAVPGFLGWILPHFLYRRIAGKRTEKITPLMEAKYDEIYETLTDIALWIQEKK